MKFTLYPDYQPIKRVSQSDAISLSKYINDVIIARFISVKDISAINTIPNSANAYKDLLDDVSELYSEPLPPTDNKHKLLLISDLSSVVNKKLIINNVKFNSVFCKSKGGAGKSAEEVNNFISNSLNTINNAIPQSQFKYSPNISYIPNWFNPIIKVNGDIVFDNSNINNIYGIDNKGLQAFGYELPFYNDINKEVNSFNNIEVYAALYNAIEFSDGIKYQRYPLTCEITLYVL